MVSSPTIKGRVTVFFWSLQLAHQLSTFLPIETTSAVLKHLYLHCRRAIRLNHIHLAPFIVLMIMNRDEPKRAWLTQERQREIERDIALVAESMRAASDMDVDEPVSMTRTHHSQGRGPSGIVSLNIHHEQLCTH